MLWHDERLENIPKRCIRLKCVLRSLNTVEKRPLYHEPLLTPQSSVPPELLILCFPRYMLWSSGLQLFAEKSQLGCFVQFIIDLIFFLFKTFTDLNLIHWRSGCIFTRNDYRLLSLKKGFVWITLHVTGLFRLLKTLGKYSKFNFLCVNFLPGVLSDLYLFFTKQRSSCVTE